MRDLYSTSLEPRRLAAQESLFHLANGYLGLRGGFPELAGSHYASSAPSLRGCYLNGFFEKVPFVYPETLVGFPLSGERLVALPDALALRIELAEQPVTPLTAGVQAYERQLDLRRGLSRHGYQYRAGQGGLLQVEVKQLLSFVRRGLCLQTLELQSLAGELRLRVSAVCERAPTVKVPRADPRVPAAASDLAGHFSWEDEGKSLLFEGETRASGLRLALATRVAGVTQGGTNFRRREEADEGRVETVFEAVLATGASLTLTRLISVSDSRRFPEPKRVALQELERAAKAGFAVLFREQEDYLAAFWPRHRLQIQGDEASSAALDFAVYSLLQSAPDDGITLIPAKGLSGEGYEGHYFWDFEIYLFPFFLWTWPERARKLLDYRLHTLPAARENARILGYDRGAQYAWRTISGPECSGYFPAGSAQVHINADIARAFYQYYLVTGDLDYMAVGGVDVLIETARTWLELGSWKDGRFQIFGVTGPDEYTCLVDNNYFTNRSAQENLRAALHVISDLQAAGQQTALVRSGLVDVECRDFAEAAHGMYLPHDSELAIDAQDDGFLSLPTWDLENTPEDHFPLLLHYHPSKLYRYQVLKQPDTTLAHFLYEDDPANPVVCRSRHYYEERTTHDSSLSPCIYGAMAALAGELKKAREYFVFSRDIDLKNLQKNTADGLHLGNLGGNWLFVVMGYAGLRLTADGLSLTPRLPREWQEVSFTLRYRGQDLDLIMRENETTLTWQGPEELPLRFHGRERTLPAKKATTLRHPQGLIFDLDGVLCHTDRFHYLAWQALCEKNHIPFDEEVNDRLRGVSRRESLDIILEQAGLDFSEKEKEELLDNKNQYYRDYLKTLTPQDFPAHYRQDLKALREKGYRLGVGSSSKNARFILERLQLTACFDAVTDGAELKTAKPHPEVFLRTAQKMGLPAQDCLVLEDARVGLEAAVAGRFTAAGFGTAAGDERAERSYTDLEEFFDSFLERNREEQHHG